MAFHFPLERVLGWRRTQLELAEARLSQQLGALAELDRTLAELEAASGRAEFETREFRPLAGEDLCALEGFRRGMKARARALLLKRAECQREVALRQAALLEARRQCRLLERLRERRLAEWQAARGREVEELAAESYLARWGRQPAADSLLK